MSPKFPTPEEIQRELEDLVRKRFGGSVQVFSNFGSNGATSAEESDPGEATVEAQPFDLDFDLKPKDIKAYLDQFVIKQNEAKKALAIAVCDHYNHVRDSLLAGKKQPSYEYSKQNVMLLGPTGVGKTYLIRKIADLIGVPFVKADATRFSETGYVGANVDDLIRDLVRNADGDIERAQHGIVYLDEADKLATPSKAMGRDVNGRGVQFGLLKLMEDTEVDLQSGNDLQSQMQAFMDFQKKGKVGRKVVSTRHILFIVSGAFHGLETIIRRRLNTNGIGFDASKNRIDQQDDLLSMATTEDFVEYGFEPEFIGRLPVRVACQHLAASDLERILASSRGSIVKQYQRAFEAYGINAVFESSALRRIAEKAAAQKTGARALMTVCEEVFRDFKFELPSSHVDSLTVTDATVDAPAEELRRLLAEPVDPRLGELKAEIRRYPARWAERHGMTIQFTGTAVDMLAKRALADCRTGTNLCDELLSNFEYGLSLVRQNTGQDSFELGDRVVTDPRGYLEELIRNSYVNKHRAERSS